MAPSGVLLSHHPMQGVAGEAPPAVLPSGRKGQRAVPAGGRAGVGPQHQESHTEHAPDLPLRGDPGDGGRGEDPGGSERSSEQSRLERSGEERARPVAHDMGSEHTCPHVVLFGE